MTITNSLPSPTYDGTAVTCVGLFYSPPGTSTLVDPTTIFFKYEVLNSGVAPVVWQYGVSGSISRISTGFYSVTLDTTAKWGTWTVEWVGTGAVEVVNATTFPVTERPI